MTEHTKQLYFTLPSKEDASAIMKSLTAMDDITTDDISMVASAETPLDDLPDEMVSEPNDFLPGLQRGVAAGGSVGLLAGLVAVTYPPAGLALGGGALLSLTGMGAAVGAVTSAVVGAGVPNPEFGDQIDRLDSGHILCRVDTPPERVEAVRDVVDRVAPDTSVDVLDRDESHPGWPLP